MSVRSIMKQIGITDILITSSNLESNSSFFILNSKPLTLLPNDLVEGEED